jgi:hypothetical protein
MVPVCKKSADCCEFRYCFIFRDLTTFLPVWASKASLATFSLLCETFADLDAFKRLVYPFAIVQKFTGSEIRIFSNL